MVEQDSIFPGVMHGRSIDFEKTRNEVQKAKKHNFSLQLNYAHSDQNWLSTQQVSTAPKKSTL